MKYFLSFFLFILYFSSECEINHSSYFTFELEKLLNISKITDYREYPELQDSLNVRQFYYTI